MAVKPGWEGRYFEDFEVGDIYRCRLGRTVTEADNIWFTLLTNNTNQIHFNNEYGKRTEFGKCLINSALTLAIVAGMGVAMTVAIVPVGVTGRLCALVVVMAVTVRVGVLHR